MASSEIVKGLFQQQTLKHHKSAQVNKELYQCYMTMHFKGNSMTGPVTTEKGISFYGEMKVTDRRTFRN
jgi:hypothetical protein